MEGCSMQKIRTEDGSIHRALIAECEKRGIDINDPSADWGGIFGEVFDLEEYTQEQFDHYFEKALVFKKFLDEEFA